MGDGETIHGTLDDAVARLARLDAELAALAARREALVGEIAGLRRALGRDAVAPDRSVVPSGRRDARRGTAARRPAAREEKMRLYWEAVEIVRAEGRPMTAPEIHGIHPMRAEHDASVLYHVLYNRVGTTLESHAGAFWPRGERLPEDWRPPAPRGRPPTTAGGRRG